ncbi:MAG: hypothetical protein KAT13_04570 [Methanosarcinales archaeon]|nr:hypothetical protein [Methanosarcinales archaeon]
MADAFRLESKSSARRMYTSSFASSSHVLPHAMLALPLPTHSTSVSRSSSGHSFAAASAGVSSRSRENRTM